MPRRQILARRKRVPYRVLWLSDHVYDSEAIDSIASALNNILEEEVFVVQKQIRFSCDGDKAYDQFTNVAFGYDVVGGDFPPQLWLTFLENIDSINKTLFVVSYKNCQMYQLETWNR